jgi:hypothetical protein
MLLRHLVRQAERFLDEDVGGAVSNLILVLVLVWLILSFPWRAHMQGRDE